MITIKKINPSAKILVDYTNNGEIDFDLPIQRGYVWTRDKKSKLILSILEGYPVPPLYANFKNDIYYIIDGQQRGKTIVGFQLDKFSLGELPTVTIDGEEYNITGKKFSELPSRLQTTIKQFNLDIHYGENMTQEEQKEMFVRLNSGKPLSTTELTKAQIKSLTEVAALSRHSAFTQIMNRKGIEASKNVSLVMQTYVALYEENKCMLSAAIKKALEDIQITFDQQEEIKKCLDVFEAAYKQFMEDKSDISKKLVLIFKRKSHFIAFLYTIHQAIQSNNFNLETLVSWCKHFFDSEPDQTTVCEEYNARLKDSMNSDESVKVRLSSMYNDYQRYIQK